MPVVDIDSYAEEPKGARHALSDKLISSTQRDERSLCGEKNIFPAVHMLLISLQNPKVCKRIAERRRYEDKHTSAERVAQRPTATRLGIV
jgi:hypothetical protein